jgi:hypothetical protein
MNYAKLVTAIEDTTENTFTVDQLNTFIKQTEQSVFQAIKFPAMRMIDTVDITAGESQFVLLNNADTTTTYLYTDSLLIRVTGTFSYTPLIQKDYSFIFDAYPDSTNDTGRPKYYALYQPGSAADITPQSAYHSIQVVLGPRQDASYTLLHTYYTYPQSITHGVTEKTSTHTSWLGDNFDNVLLNGALVEAARFMKAEQDIVAIYNEQYLSSLKLAAQLSENLLRDGNSQ